MQVLTHCDMSDAAVIILSAVVPAHAAGARIQVHMPRHDQVHLALQEEVLQDVLQVAPDDAVGLVRVGHIHGAVHADKQPRRHAAIHARQVSLQPLRSAALSASDMTLTSRCMCVRQAASLC